MNRKKIAFEAALISLALLVAFVVQLFLAHTRPPKIPNFEREEGKLNTLSAVNHESATSEIAQFTTESNKLMIPALYEDSLSSLGVRPNWQRLDSYQRKLTSDEFFDLLTTVYVKGDFWKDWFEFGDDYVDIKTDSESSGISGRSYRLFFAKAENIEAVAYDGRIEKYWRSRNEILNSQLKVPPSQPLANLNVAIDPGHIGGGYAQVEQRNFVLSEDHPPVQEGNMTLIVAEMLQRQLEVLGAQVSLVRESNNPVNPYRPQDYIEYAESKLTAQGGLISKVSVEAEAQRLFYRNGEIRARAFEINERVRPDVVLCLHFNAAGQADPDAPVLVDQEHFHILLNGAYTEAELANEDERFQCVFKILQGIHREELEMARCLVASFVKETGLPAYQYNPESLRAVNLGDDPYIWGRNLLANRLYDCPVLFFEPYLMNGSDSFYRMQMGGYDGLRYLNGQLRPSIYREYVDSVVRGLVSYYTVQKLPIMQQPVETSIEVDAGASADRIKFQPSHHNTIQPESGGDNSEELDGRAN